MSIWASVLCPICNIGTRFHASLAISLDLLLLLLWSGEMFLIISQSITHKQWQNLSDKLQAALHGEQGSY